MARIHLLDDALINKIAAGEVVERPASVVKELVENALDAGAKSLRVELDEGGRKRIAVTDDGSGMDEEDARMCLERHATSKIRSADDLFQVATMGFRGEALAAIAGVARFTLNTKERQAKAGWRVVANDEGRTVTDWNGPSGTSIHVEDLFYNVPARRHFLKKPGLELAHCLELLKQIALARPDIGFTVLHNGREQLVAPALTESLDKVDEQVLRARAIAVCGKDAKDLMYVDRSLAHGRVFGLISPPGLERTTGRDVYTFVNRRPVRDKVVRFAVQRGYHSHLMKGRHPFVVLFLETDPTLVDVNVHPAKTEVRFQYPQEMGDLIAGTIREALRGGEWIQPTAPETSSGSAVSPSYRPTPRFDPPVRDRSVTVTRSSYDFPKGSSPAPARSTPNVSFDGLPMPSWTREETQPAAAPASPLAFFESGHEETAATTHDDVPWLSLAYLGTFGACYQFYEWGERLLVVDQHAFHERILYEKLTRDHKLLESSQPLLMPEVIELGSLHVARFGEAQDTLRKLGFEVVPVSTTEVEVRAVPALLSGKDVQAVLETIGVWLEGTDEVGTDVIHHEVLSTIACHSAVRAGETMTDEDRELLLRQAGEVDFFHNCPHGRRVLRLFEKRAVADWFDR